MNSPGLRAWAYSYFCGLRLCFSFLLFTSAWLNLAAARAPAAPGADPRGRRHADAAERPGDAVGWDPKVAGTLPVHPGLRHTWAGDAGQRTQPGRAGPAARHL